MASDIQHPINFIVDVIIQSGDVVSIPNVKYDAFTTWNITTNKFIEINCIRIESKDEYNNSAIITNKELIRPFTVEYIYRNTNSRFVNIIFNKCVFEISKPRTYYYDTKYQDCIFGDGEI